MGSGRQDREQTRAVESRAAWGDLAAQLRAGADSVSCVRPDELAHRRTDWRLPATDELEAGPWVCGLCHPPAPADVERRDAPGEGELAPA